jgi:iron complex transport system substrate-binding protein
MPSDHIPRRIVSLQPSATVILRDMDRLDLLVARTKYCEELCPEVRNLNIAIVADSWSAQSEQIRALEPDLVIASVPYQEKSVIEILKAHTPLLALAPRKLADIYSDIALISRIVDAADAGQEVIQRMKCEIAQIREQTKNLPRPQVFCEEWGKPLIASQQWVAELVEAAGGEFLGVPGKQILADEVVASAPEIIVAAWCGAGDRVPLEKLIERRNWQQVPAAKNNRVYCITDEYLNTPAPTLVRGLRALATAIHPEHFPQPEGLRCINTPR